MTLFPLIRHLSDPLLEITWGSLGTSTNGILCNVENDYSKVCSVCNTSSALNTRNMDGNTWCGGRSGAQMRELEAAKHSAPPPGARPGLPASLPPSRFSAPLPSPLCAPPRPSLLPSPPLPPHEEDWRYTLKNYTWHFSHSLTGSCRFSLCLHHQSRE